MNKNTLLHAINIFGLAVLYFGAAKLGLALAFEAAQVTVVWPPTGIALAAILLFGYRMWPGIALGAFLANVTTNEPFATALGISLGNTLEALAGALMMRQFTSFDNRLSHMQSVLALIFFSAFLSTMISATIGVTSLCLGGVQPWEAYGSLWQLWWLGDAVGALIIAPVLLVWSSGRYRFQNAYQIAEACVLVAGLLVVCDAIFSDPPILGINGSAFIYIIFPFIIWAAFRFGQRGTTGIILVATTSAVWATLQGFGPFNGTAIHQELKLLQLFMGVVSVTGLLLGAAVTAHKKITEVLRESEERLLLADQRKDEFLAILAHELRNPLTPIANAVHILQQPDLSSARRAEVEHIINRQMQHLVHLVDDLLDVSRISNNKIELRKHPVLLADVIHNAVEIVRPLVDKSRHSLSVTLPDEQIWLHADSTRLSQIFANLLNNAAKYTPAGGKIWLTAETSPDTVKIKVRDSGIGIPDNMLHKIFEMFTQVDTTIERSYGGLGIGLMLVKNLVEMHGGHVQASSQGSGKGSEFVIELPRTQMQQALPKAPAAPAPVIKKTNGKLRVLAVDDDQALAKTLGWMLEALNHESRMATDWNSALAAAREFNPQVVMLDIGMPGMSGYEMCQKLRMEPGLKHSIFIAQTGWGQPEHQQRAREAGFDYHLVKPVDITALETLLSSLDIKRSPD